MTNDIVPRGGEDSNDRHIPSETPTGRTSDLECRDVTRLLRNAGLIPRPPVDTLELQRRVMNGSR